jgi:hypothetical protein
MIHRLPRIIGGRAALWVALSQPLFSADARRLNWPRTRTEPARFDLAYCLLDARDQIVANGFLLRQRVVNASELVAHLHENVPRVVRALCVAMEVQLGPKIGYEVNKQLSSLCSHRSLLGSRAQRSIDGIDEALDLVHWASPFAHLSVITPGDNYPPSNELHVWSCMQDRTPHLVIREDGEVGAILNVHSRA